MTATLAPSPWPAPASSRTAGDWRFARELADAQGWRFDLRRNVSLSPRQLASAYALLCAVSLAVAGAFWWHGVSLVVAFTGIELLAVGLALLVVSRHAGDREIITLGQGTLQVEQRFGQGTERTDFRAEWVRVEPVAADGSLVELSGGGRSVRVGRHVRPELRQLLAQELRRALRHARSLRVTTSGAVDPSLQ